ncbi:MAG: fibrobacter succinogenes major paralogous domain-containing protein [Fibrobacter sp.]|nr:fibrobacter succinogenes major paralogous domain-containing protein [Fibrobacter sp.]
MNKKFFLVLSSIAVLLSACGGESGSNASDDFDSSSSVILSSSSVSLDSALESSSSEDSDESSSSSDVLVSSSSIDSSSSSVSLDSASESSSSEGSDESSSSSDILVSSSSIDSSSSSVSSDSAPESSSSEGTDESSSSRDVLVSSSSMESSSSSVTPESSDSMNDGSVYDVATKTLKDLRDGKTYKTVTIGTQEWMAENLNYAYNKVKFNYGGYTSDSTSWCHENKSSNCDKYGRLYLWSAVMDSVGEFSTAGKGCGLGEFCKPTGKVRGLCPEGWHLPTKAEWEKLFDAVGGASSAGKMLKSISGWYNNGNGTDSYGFNVIPASSRDFSDVNLSSLYPGNARTRFWSASEYTVNAYRSAYNAHFDYMDDSADMEDFSKYFGMPVRCVWDEVPDPESSVSNGKDESKYNAAANTLEDFRNDKTYKTVTIGTQTWMAENLKYAYNNGSAKSYCYDNSADSCAKYGRLYTWSAAMDSAAVFSTSSKDCGYNKTCSSSGTVRGVCPKGWHMPSKAEFETLESAVGGTGVGTKLKSTSGWNDDGNGTDDYGFSALPAGYSYPPRGSFFSAGKTASFWFASEYNDGYADIMKLYHDSGAAHMGVDEKYYGLSVRCLKDSD